MGDRRVNTDRKDDERRRVDASIRDAYEGGRIYKTETINLAPRDDAQAYAERLLAEKIATVRRHVRPGLLVDLCCGNGEHLFALDGLASDSLGIDFSRPFIDHARAQVEARALKNMRFEVGDARNIALPDNGAATLYSLSALYTIPGLDEVMSEIARVLRPGGRCILDLANSQSLNAISVRAYTDLPQSFHVTVAEMRRLCAANNLRIIEHRRFQILPLWADKPGWMWPLLHPVWKTILSRRIAGHMLDEWIASLPVLRNFAFRHILVCEKTPS